MQMSLQRVREQRFPAMRLTKWHPALGTARGLLIRLRLDEVRIDLVEICTAFVSLTLVGCLLIDRDEGKHALLRHRSTG